MERFGKYVLQDRIATGGMAEVYFAKTSTQPHGVAVKRILPEYSDEPDFIRMFIDEANVLASLRHANIVEILDLGVVDGSYFIAMEYVPGLALSRLLKAFAQQDMPRRLLTAAYLAREVARGLAFAHAYRDGEGRHLGIVHRDVSPPNILLSTSGEVKIIDFGVAFAYHRVAQTRSGSLKGKLAYMSPEQARGSAVDHRSDIFSLGAVLHQLLTGEKLYKADSEMALLTRVQRGPTATLDYGEHGLPPDVQHVLEKSLATSVDERYGSAAVMANDLSDYLASTGQDPSKQAASHLAELTRRAIKERQQSGKRMTFEGLPAKRRPAGSASYSRPDKTPRSYWRRRQEVEEPTPSSGQAQIDLPIRTEKDILNARRRGMEVGRHLGMPKPALVKLGTVISDLARALLHHSGGGTFRADLLPGERPRLRLRFTDEALVDEDEATITGCASGAREGMGTGIAVARKLVDHFSMETGADGATVITAIQYL